MARQVANVDIQVDTFGSWIARTNELLESFSNEVLTANSTSGVTGTPTNNRNATLYGRFNTNTFFASETFQVGTGIHANTTVFTFGPNIKIRANNTIGTTGQILAIGTTGLYWTDAGLGTVTKVESGNGLTGNVTTSGTLSVKAGTGITVTAGGVNIDPNYISSLSAANANALQNRTWQAPAPIGNSIANTGAFTTLTSNAYSLTNDAVFSLNSTFLRHGGYLESFTPATGDTGAVNIRAVNGGVARIRATDYLGSTTFGTATINSSGRLLWSGNFAANSATFTGSTVVTGTLTVSSSNSNGGGIILSNEGDIVDLNDGYASLRFASGVAVYSGNKGGSSAIRLKNNGVIEAGGKIYAEGNKEVLTADSFTNGTGIGSGSSPGSTGNWVRLPNGMLLQWGTMPSQQDSTATVFFPQAFSTTNVSVVVSGGVKNGNNSAGENPTTVVAVASSYFQTWTTENVNTTAWWIAMGF